MSKRANCYVTMVYCNKIVYNIPIDVCSKTFPYLSTDKISEHVNNALCVCVCVCCRCVLS